MINIKFIKTHPDAQLPIRKNATDTGYDVFAVEDAVIPSKSDRVVQTGITVADITEGYWFSIYPRSGMGFKGGIQPHLGIVDNCVPAGTQITTSVGMMNVEDLFNTEKKPNIISYNTEKSMLQDDTIKDMWIVENRELVKISTENGIELEVPSEKQLYTKRGWVQASHLTDNDEILTIC